MKLLIVRFNNCNIVIHAYLTKANPPEIHFKDIIISSPHVFICNRNAIYLWDCLRKTEKETYTDSSFFSCYDRFFL